MKSLVSETSEIWLIQLKIDADLLGRIIRISSTSRKYKSLEYPLPIRSNVSSSPLCAGRCSCLHRFGRDAISSISWKENVETALYLYSYLHREIFRMWRRETEPNIWSSICYFFKKTRECQTSAFRSEIWKCWFHWHKIYSLIDSFESRNSIFGSRRIHREIDRCHISITIDILTQQSNLFVSLIS